MRPSRQVPPPDQHTPVPEGALESVIIRLDRTACFGTCPGYGVELTGRGDVLYHGDRFVLVPGDHRTHIAPETVRCLIDDFRAADFWSLRPEYSAAATDLPTFKLTLSIAGQTKTIIDYAGGMVEMPRAVTDLENEVDQVSGDEAWIIGDTRTVPALEAEGFDFKGDAGADLLARAVASKAPDKIFAVLVAKGAPSSGHAEYLGEDMSAAEIAALRGRLEVLRTLVEAGAFATGKPDLRAATLRAAIDSHRVDVVSEVLKLHPDIDGQDDRGDTALHLTATGGRFGLIHVGPKGAVPPPDDNIAIIRLLVQAGANPNLPNRQGRTALHDAIAPDIARAFIEGGAKLDIRDNDGETALLAARYEDVAVVFLKAGADPQAKNNDGRTFVDIARANGWRKALAASEAHGVN